MKTRVELDPQVAGFLRSLAPEPRKQIRAAIRGLEQKSGDLKVLEDELAGFSRLRIGHYRVIVQFYSEEGQQVARCVYAERRSVVYQLFAEILEHFK